MTDHGREVAVDEVARALDERLSAMITALRTLAGSQAARSGAGAALEALARSAEVCRELARGAGSAGSDDPCALRLAGAVTAANDGGDPRVARALGAMARDLAAPWTVASLAKTVGMSRAAFARLFTAAVGVPPLRHLGALRMREAVRLLGTTDDGLAALAARLGYASEFAFSRAFKRHVGVAPAVHRRRARTGAATGPAPVLRAAA